MDDSLGEELLARVRQLESVAHEANQELRRELDESSAELAEVKETIELQEAEIADLATELDELRREVAELETKLEDVIMLEASVGDAEATDGEAEKDDDMESSA